ncbi:glycoside hydrolase family 97 N-terminal domain-containing protein, partial [Psychrobacter sp. I-STPA6b]|uniref:glycoside hydrolase family 97 N-terminal domain-containing protein n=1 Tax=Psychrobacter sp. I-STPA6b TaxID=2585718 RepID=UPI002222572B
MQSPNGKMLMEFALQTDGTPTYTLAYKNKAVIKTSKMGLELKNDKKSLLNDFTVVDQKTSTVNENWQPVWGEVATITNN